MQPIRAAFQILAAGFLLSGVASADEISFSVSETAFFQPTGTTQLMGLSFESSIPAGGLLQGTTNGGEYGPFALGVFTLVRDTANNNYQQSDFNLALKFGLPIGLVADQSEPFQADLSGLIHKPNASQDDQLTIDFETASQFLRFDNDVEHGSFLLSIIGPVIIDLPKDQNSATGILYAKLSEADPISSVPEPNTLALLVSAVAGLCISRKLTFRNKPYRHQS